MVGRTTLAITHKLELFHFKQALRLKGDLRGALGRDAGRRYVCLLGHPRPLPLETTRRTSPLAYGRYGQTLSPRLCRVLGAYMSYDASARPAGWNVPTE